MKEKDPERIAVQGSPTRCPFCHDDVGLAQENAVCHDCLARHHSACWDEGGACANCGSTARMERKGPPDLTPERARAALLGAGFAAEQVDALLAGASEGDRGERLRAALALAVAVPALFLVTGVTLWAGFDGMISDELMLPVPAVLVVANLLVGTIGRRVDWTWWLALGGSLSALLAGAAVAPWTKFGAGGALAAAAVGLPLATVTGALAALFARRLERSEARSSAAGVEEKLAKLRELRGADRS